MEAAQVQKRATIRKLRLHKETKLGNCACAQNLKIVHSLRIKIRTLRLRNKTKLGNGSCANTVHKIRKLCMCKDKHFWKLRLVEGTKLGNFASAKSYN